MLPAGTRAVSCVSPPIDYAAD